MNILERDLEMIAGRTAPLWEAMRGQRIFLTGGTGFFGCWLLESFCHANREMNLAARATILTRDPGSFERKCPHLAANPALTLLQGDVRSFDFPAGEFRYVIHAATEARAQQAAEAPLEMLSTIVDGARRTLEFAASRGTKSFLLTSSGAVYGKQPSEMTHVPETYLGGPDPLDPASVYAEGKRLAEQLCVQYTKKYGIGAKIARC
jgi:dTDP-glucose 4,6-dehydratase